ncbi:2-amino-4-hydroxy-6-hydroxymethyldihydropteridine diphosphokinase [uncultured Sphingomonas sp.]|uniref:2-amino-4-hydroxy-6- hydroxymethyldihydropteridine diphosphokinase n=1 Tax=uncultured Sphingomonas sp. TaxID=158754 RepID=UPI0035CC050D
MSMTYVIALGSNRRSRHGAPAAAIRAALAVIGDVVALSPAITTAPIGPARRRFANAIAVIATDETPPVLLARLKAIETRFGRRPGARWHDRVIDLDIILWDGGTWADDRLTIPHPAFRQRRFVLDPLAHLMPNRRDPVTGRTMRQLAARLTRRRPDPRARAAGAGP